MRSAFSVQIPSPVAESAMVNVSDRSTDSSPCHMLAPRGWEPSARSILSLIHWIPFCSTTINTRQSTFSSTRTEIKSRESSPRHHNCGRLLRRQYVSNHKLAPKQTHFIPPSWEWISICETAESMEWIQTIDSSSSTWTKFTLKSQIQDFYNTENSIGLHSLTPQGIFLNHGECDCLPRETGKEAMKGPFHKLRKDSDRRSWAQFFACLVILWIIALIALFWHSDENTDDHIDDIITSVVSVHQR